MDSARAEILERVWQAIISRKRALTAAIVELRSSIRRPGSDVHKIVREIEACELKISLLDELVAEATSV